MVKNFFHIIRWQNLLMVAIIQYVIYSRLILASQSILSLADFAILSCLTMLIAASGYIINDYYDSRIDHINRPARWIAGNTWSMKKVLNIYFFLVALGLIIAVFLGFRILLLRFIFIYPLAIAGLWLYSYTLKCKPVAGNVWVSLFCGGVILVVALPDFLLDHQSAIRNDIWYYAAFAFLATWYREMVKDLEDVEGDNKAGCQTFAVRYGLASGKSLAMILGVFLLAAMYVWDVIHTDNTVRLVFTVLQGAIIASMAFIWWARNNTYFHNASLIIKAVMLGGTLMLLII